MNKVTAMFTREELQAIKTKALRFAMKRNVDADNYRYLIRLADSAQLLDAQVKIEAGARALQEKMRKQRKKASQKRTKDE